MDWASRILKLVARPCPTASKHASDDSGHVASGQCQCRALNYRRNRNKFFNLYIKIHFSCHDFNRCKSEIYHI